MSQEIPKVKVSKSFNFFTSIWIVPFIALIVAAWLSYEYFSKLGPEIKIVFPKNEGLSVGQSHIKYKNISLGVVTSIKLQEDSDDVIITVRMDNNTNKYLNENTKFWIVKPEVGLGGISGLDTIISGTYINMYFKKGKEFKDKFQGIKQAYKKASKGSYFNLSSIKHLDINKNTPVFFKGINVGSIENIELSSNSKQLNYSIFILKKYVSLVHEDSKFWVNSMINVNLINSNLDISIAPLENIMHGGVSFSSSIKDTNNIVSKDFIFNLYKNKSAAQAKILGVGGKQIKEFLIHTNKSIANLKKGAFVKYDGFTVGEVQNIALSFDSKSKKMLGKVLLNIDTSSFIDKSTKDQSGYQNFLTELKSGLSAKLNTSDPITSNLYIDLVYDKSNERTSVESNIILNSNLYEKDSLSNGLATLLTKLNNLPIEKLITSLTSVANNSNKIVKNSKKPIKEILSNLKSTLNNINVLSSKKSFKALPDEIAGVLKQLEKTIKSTNQVIKGYDTNSLMSAQLTQTLKALTASSNEMKDFLKLLNRKPDSLIFGDK